ncbi:MAG: YkoF family thiamine/hydroxymethylpyrimidine-binding protein [Steroidobacteraceae bacterium]
MRSAVEISMYPLTRDYLAPIQAFIDRLNTHPGLIVRTNALATQIWGPLDHVMAVLTQEIARSASVADAPQLVFVMKVLPGLSPPDSAQPPGARR